LYPCRTVLVVESGDDSAKLETQLEPGKWNFMSVSISDFQRGDKFSSGGMPLSSITLKFGESGIPMEVYIDDLSISEGPVEAPR